ncbi:Astacin-like metalloendopeptidase [Strongyloides ratti]|uniref:Metalloendopeptidase n=1 Tax=Strongyloides ratti TaxID=34506 RepID=A0A090N023_STRRB|nr:Astacin-like metalloendopeptidase [Strongyloides ratti]CEF69935.1 Astacin-like metalloendopeptidase [Strongyloides ratti]
MFYRYIILLLIFIITIKAFGFTNFSNPFFDDNFVVQRKKRGILKFKSNLWSEREIEFYINDTLNYNTILYALYLIRKETCLKFKQTYNPKKALFSYQPDKYYHTKLGKGIEIPHKIYVHISVKNIKLIIRETMRALGIDYEHNRPDRNRYVIINIFNINPFFFNFFEKRSSRTVDTYGFGYDYRSIMHFSSYEYSMKGRKTIESRDKLMISSIGKSEIFTFNDIKLLNYKYCTFNNIPRIHCRHYGYPDPKLPTRCKCLPFMYGDLCQFRLENRGLCTHQNSFLATPTISTNTILVGGICYFYIGSDNGGKIKLQIKYNNDSNIFYNNKEYHGIEVKYKSDLSVSGVYYPPTSIPLNIISETDMIVIQSKFTPQITKVSISYREILQ